MSIYTTIILAGSDNDEFRKMSLSPSKFQFRIREDHMLINEIYQQYQSPYKTIIACLSAELTTSNFREEFPTATFVEIKGSTQGALTTLGMTVDEIEENVPILVTPADGLVFDKVVPFVKEMAEAQVASGVMVFRSTNPNYSYVRSEGNFVIEIAEKRIVGSLATTGIYYFENKRVLLDCLKWVLLHNLHVNGLYYMSVGINQLIAQKKEVRLFEILESEYFRFATPKEAIESKDRMVVR